MSQEIAMAMTVLRCQLGDVIRGLPHWRLVRETSLVIGWCPEPCRSGTYDQIRLNPADCHSSVRGFVESLIAIEKSSAEQGWIIRTFTAVLSLVFSTIRINTS